MDDKLYALGGLTTGGNPSAAAEVYDPATGTIARPELLPAEPIHGCGGSECSPAETATETQAA